MRTLLWVLLIIPGTLLAQLKVDPIVYTSIKKAVANTRTQAGPPISLPFWDDFSFTNEVPSDSLWVDSDNVRVSADVGLAPPSINVASFDGLTATGEAYSPTSTSTGQTDVLTSCPIGLDGLNPGNNVYLSFFYQFGGAGENPELTQGDSLILEFFSVSSDTSLWRQVWPLENDIVNREGDFEQHIVQLNSDTYFTDEFQFRFRAFGRQSGLWDTWNVDYIYLNDNRNENDLFYPDRNITSRLTSPFAPYTSVPGHFFSAELIDSAKFTRNNLSEDPTAVSVVTFFNITSFLNDIETVFPEIENNIGIEEVNVSPATSLPGVTDSVTIPVLMDPLFEDPFDSMYISYRLEYGSRDDIEPTYDNIDFRINDVSSGEYFLKNYYAYDDGTAEFGAGFDRSGNLLAYQFTLPEGESDSLTAIDMHFPYIGSDPTGKNITLSVWTDSNGSPGTRLYQQSATAVRTDSINKFFHYELLRPVILSGTFYVGYRQGFEGDLRIGLDRNTNSVNRIFTNTSGFWEEETDLRTGSLMIRPVFGTFTGTINSLSDISAKNLAPYPNPTTGLIKLKENVRIELFDLSGRPMEFKSQKNGSETLIDISNFVNGVYLLQLRDGERRFSYRIIKQ
ncbi:MAG: T9SS type A sorting domain-containing protein [Bacteroidota bacterium]